MSYLMTYMGNKGREIYSTMKWKPEEAGIDAIDGNAAQDAVPAENATLAGVWGKF